MVVIPPAAMLGLYVLLLRETALADADSAGGPRPRPPPTAGVAAQWPAVPCGPGRPEAGADGPRSSTSRPAPRAKDQLYDQYADATVRAVGD